MSGCRYYVLLLPLLRSSLVGLEKTKQLFYVLFCFRAYGWVGSCGSDSEKRKEFRTVDPPAPPEPRFPESVRRASSDTPVTVQQEARNDIGAFGREGFHAGD